MEKYRRKPEAVEAKLFETGMEDGYVSHTIGGNFIGIFKKGEALPKANNTPLMKTSKGWHEVEDGKYYVVINAEKEQYVVEKSVFEQEYDLITE